jgi:putative transposase
VGADEKDAAAGLAAGGVPADGTAMAGPGREQDAVSRLADLVSVEAVDRMLADADAAGVSAERLLGQLTRTVLERALGAELDDHLGQVKGDPAGRGRGTPATAAAGLAASGVPVRGQPCS